MVPLAMCRKYSPCVTKVLRRSDRQVYAMKKIKMGALNEKEKQNALNEIRLLASLN